MLFKYLAFKVVDSISDVIKDHLTWNRIGRLSFFLIKLGKY